MSANLPFIFVKRDCLVAFDGWWVGFVFYQEVASVLAAYGIVNLLLEPKKLYTNWDLLFEILVAVGSSVIICADLRRAVFVCSVFNESWRLG